MYDYVIVGAGSAGCVLAARLTQDPDVTVLLLEAGAPDTADEIHIPAALNTLFLSEYDWGYRTTAQPRAADRRVYWPRGRTLGGSSSTNAMIYIRGNRLDYDAWRDAGCTGWGYADLLPYFVRSEHNTRGRGALHGDAGPQWVSDPRYRSPACRAFVDAARAHGLAGNDDFNGPRQDGVGFYQLTQSRGRRWSTADGYLRPALDRPGLTVATGALVERVVVEHGRAVAVRYRHRGQLVEARADREVIVSAGAVNTPQVLKLSGIGPAAELREHGIEVHADLPGVGANLMDHPIVTLRWRTPSSVSLAERVTPAQIVRWQLTHRGPLTSNTAESGGFARTDESLPAPNLQWCVIAASYLDQGLTDPAERELSALITLLTPASRGTVKLADADPAHAPLIDAGYLTDPADAVALAAGVRLTREIGARPPLAGMVTGESAPGQDLTSDEDLTEWIRGNLATLYHPVGSCAMGAGDDAPCDTELRVRGIEALRVVDAGVMPVIPRGNTNAPTIAIAERAADLIAGRTPLPPVDVDLG